MVDDVDVWIARSSAAGVIVGKVTKQNIDLDCHLNRGTPYSLLLTPPCPMYLQ
jgi:hypothetical protein